MLANPLPLSVPIHYTAAPAAPLWRWPHFSPRELACKGDGMLMIHPDSLDTLERFRALLGRPIVLNSAYRSPAYNARVGGAPTSQHMHARAFDVRLQGDNGRDLERLAIDAGFRGIGRYPELGFIHMDTGPRRNWGQW